MGTASGITAQPASLLALINSCDNFTLPAGPWDYESCAQHYRSWAKDNQSADLEDRKTFLVPFFVSLPSSPTSDAERPSQPSKFATTPSQPIGFLRRAVVDALRWWLSSVPREESGFELLDHLPAEGVAGAGTTSCVAVGFTDAVNEGGSKARTELMRNLVRRWKDAGLFVEQLGGWRNEEYTIYGPANLVRDAGAGEGRGSNVAFTLERSACPLFGLLAFGVHCTAYIAPTPSSPLKLWIPRRSATKQTWPSFLDNTVAGGITAGHLPTDSILRECAEEASLPASFVSPRLKSVGIISYTYRNPSSGWLQPEVQYVYDLSMEGGDDAVKPMTNVEDGEVESFGLMELEEVVERMRAGEFKPNCAVVLVDFLVRHGYLTPENDENFVEIATRLRNSLVLPGPAAR